VAVSPQGRAENLGELTLKNRSGEVITDMQTFGMIVSAEPYFAVTQPGTFVVLENAAGEEAQPIEARCELLGREAYVSSNTKIENAIFGIDSKTPLALFEARNAVRISRNAAADKYAATSLTKAEQQLQTAEDAYRQRRDRKAVEAAARDAVQTAEEARVMAVKARAEEEAQTKIAADKRAALEREANARADAEAELQRRKACGTLGGYETHSPRFPENCNRLGGSARPARWFATPCRFSRAGGCAFGSVPGRTPRAHCCRVLSISRIYRWCPRPPCDELEDAAQGICRPREAEIQRHSD